MKRLISALVLVMLMVSMFALAFSVKPARSSPATITVPDDYSTIQAAINVASSGDTVYVRAGTYRENVVVGSKALSLVGENPQSTIIDGGGTGDVIRITGDGVSVRGFMVRNSSSQYSAGIHLEGANHCNITGNNITDDWVGIGIFYSDSNFVFGNNIAGNQFGIMLFGSGNMIFHNSFVNNTLSHAIVLFSDSYPVAPVNFWDDGYPSGGNYWSDYNGTDVYSGPYQNETGSDGIGDTYYPTDYVPLLYRDDYPLMRPWVPFEGQTIYIRADGSIDPSAAPIDRAGNYYTLTENVTSTANGIVIQRSNIILDGAGYTIQGAGSYDGTMLSSVTNVTVKNARITGFARGLHLYSSLSNTVSGNNMTANSVYGVLLDSSSGNMVSGNNIVNNGFGVYFYYSSNNTVSGDSVTTNDWYGFYLDHSLGNAVFRNSFVGNNKQVHSDGSPNVWDNGSEGNYWSDYDGSDLYNGPYQNETGSDGIGDVPYIIDANNIDHYPLMGSYAVLNIIQGIHIQMVSNSTISDFQFNGTAILFNVSGENGMTGFCRICIPAALMSSSYRVFVNSTEVAYTLLPFSNSTNSYLYFSYSHSTQQVIVIPECPSLTILLLLMTISSLTILSAKKRPRKLHL